MAFYEPPEVKAQVPELRELFVDGPGENSNQTTTTGIFLNDDEKELFSAVERGDFESLVCILLHLCCHGRTEHAHCNDEPFL